MELRFTIQTKIQRPVSEVFDAVFNPTKLTRYFATESASGPLVEGDEVSWRFADYPDDVRVKVKKVVSDRLIVFEWESGEKGYDTRVEMNFERLDDGATLVKITESGWRETQKGLESSYGNCEGWTQMSASLKAFLEHGINLREGYY